MPVIRLRMIGVAAACLTLTLLAGACGGHSAATPTTPASNGVATKPPEQILSAAKRALGATTSVHLHGKFRDSGQWLTIDLVVGKTGAKGSMTGPLQGVKQASFDFVAIGRKIYIRSNTLWRQAGGATAAALLDNRWVLLPSSAEKDFPFINMSTFASELPLISAGSQALSVGAATAVNGHPAIPVVTTDSTVYVATTGPPLPLRVTQASASGGTAVADFTDYNAPVNITVPPNPIDLSKVNQSG